MIVDYIKDLNKTKLSMNIHTWIIWLIHLMTLNKIACILIQILHS